MTREEADKLLPIIKAYSEGKVIQFEDDGNWCDLTNPGFGSNPNFYRIKPQPKYRPFKDDDECWAEILKHQPFGWVESQEYGKEMIVSIASINFEKGFQYYTFVDGTPFGKLEEE